MERQNIDYIALFKTLPHVNGDKEIVEDWGYTPNLYHFDTKWHVTWIHCDEGDGLFGYTGDTPEEAILNAYNHYKEEIKSDN